MSEAAGGDIGGKRHSYSEYSVAPCNSADMPELKVSEDRALRPVTA